MKRITILSIFFISLVYGCTDLELIPESSLSPEGYYQNEADAKTSVGACYTELLSQFMYNQYMEVLNSQGTDDAEWSNGRNTMNADKNELDKFTFTSATKLVYEFWRTIYTSINRCNTAIDNVSSMTSTQITDTRKNQYIGEAKFIRALLYFNLVRIYGKVPLVTKSTSSLNNLMVPRNTVSEVYNQIIEDLIFAETNLPKKETYASGDLGRATKGAAASLLARVYLAKGDYQKVIDKTTEVMALGYSLWAIYADNFDIAKKNGKESIFELQAKAGTGNPGTTFNGFFRPGFVKINGWTGYGDDPVTKNHYDAYKAGDLRRAVNVRLYTLAEFPNMSNTIEYPCYVNKYQDLSVEANVSNGGNNIPILRYSDIYLMRAEALSQINSGDVNAYNNFNAVRRRAYGKPIDQPSVYDLKQGLSKEQFLDSVLVERRLEFAFEGQRRFDLLRTKKLKEAMISQNPAIGAVIEEKHMLLPVPQIERDANNLLDQNPGW
ncbi:MAG: RagB/SusD family nutrient uptake outer membrane protein [Bacteroidota bacterium]|nr:RagB/SusD family nutrient uptake outer membrane protein [Bacteroidota bacterium]